LDEEQAESLISEQLGGLGHSSSHN
jgi:hypothetical protein